MESFVQIPKDLKKVKTKVAFNLTKRQLIGFSVAGLIGIPIYLYTRQSVGNEIAMLFLIAVSMPAFFFTFYEKDGLSAEKYLKCIYLHEKHQPKVRIKKKEYIKRRKEELNEQKNKGTRKNAKGKEKANKGKQKRIKEK